jgi:hypothetical protein
MSNFNWKGKYNFQINGSGLHEDTLRIVSNYRKQEQMIRLVLPTLCITYADAKFQDSIGGIQENYPASQVYGPSFFNPPVTLSGEKDIEKYTYIRGAHKVEIGDKRTVIEFPSWKELVIPRLRLDQKQMAEAYLDVPDTQIRVEEPLQLSVMQFADGRHVGGVRMEKRHPEWKEPEIKEVYQLWIRVIDGLTQKPLPKVKVDILHWDDKASGPYGSGNFRPDASKYTDEHGCIIMPDRPAGELEAFVVRKPGSRAVVRCLRPLPGQKVRLHMRLWPMKRENEVDRMIFFKALYQPEPWDTLDWLGKNFGYKDAEGLAKANGLLHPAELAKLPEIRLPDWHFIVAGEGDTLEKYDAFFKLPKGSSRPVGRVYHPHPRLPYTGEAIAIPDPEFAEKLKK